MLLMEFIRQSPIIFSNLICAPVYIMYTVLAFTIGFLLIFHKSFSINMQKKFNSN